MRYSTTPLFDHLVGAAEQRVGGTLRPSALAVFEVDDQLDFGGLLHGQVGRLVALE